MANNSPFADHKLINLFNEWGVDYSITDIFIKNGITYELLNKLNDYDLREMCPQLAARIRLREKINEFSANAKKLRRDVEKSEEISKNLSDNSDLLEENYTLPCIECNELLSNFNSYVHHLKFVHQISNYYECPIDKCSKTYHTKYSLKYHLIHSHLPDKKHDHFNNFEKELLTELNPDENNKEVHYCNPDVSNIFHSDKSTNNVASKCNDETLPINFETLFFHKVEEYLSNLYNILNIPRSIIQTLFTLTQSLFDDLATEVNAILCKPVKDGKIVHDEILSVFTAVKVAFNTLNTEHNRIKHFTSLQYYIKPQSVSIGSITKPKTVENRVIMSVKEKFAYIVPLDKTLQCFLELPGVFCSIIDYQKQLLFEKENSNRTIIRNVIQGKLWEDIIIKFGKDQILFPLVIYFDDLETGNPLGSRAGKNKLGAVYTSIATVPPNMSSRLENIFLSLLFYSHDRSNFGNNSIFKHLISDLKNLETKGINISVDKEQFNIKFVVVTMSGDNLGLHSILGFFESFNATNYCRICTTNKSDCKSQTVEDPKKIRVIDKYDSDVEDRLTINESCIWHDLPNFHVYNNWSVDVMHDLMEGVHRYSMALIIENLKKKYFSLVELNSRIKYFLYSDSDTVIPPITESQLKNKCIIISASEMLCFVRNFAFIIGDLVEEKDNTWEYYLLLLELTEILTAQTFTEDLILYLENLISEHHQKFLDIFKENLKPKYHLLIHYPMVIRKIGPPIFISSFKGESKHREIKKVCVSITSRIQIPLSAAIRCQLKACFRYISNKGLNNCITYSKISHQSYINKNEFSVDWYEVNGIKYKINTVILYKFDNFDEPIFYLIENIYVNRSNDNIATLQCSLLKCIGFNYHLRAYNVTRTTENKICLIEECNSVPLILHDVNNHFFVSLVKV